MKQDIILLITGFIKQTGKVPKSVRMHPKTLYVFREEWPFDELMGVPLEEDPETTLGSVYLDNPIG